MFITSVMAVTTDKSLEKKIENALSQIRPFLLEDGGDVQLVEITSDMVVRVELKGACRTCAMSNMTFNAGVEDAIRRAAPEVRKVEAVTVGRK